MDNTIFTAEKIKPVLLATARRIERLHIGKVKRGKLDPNMDKEVFKLMLIYNSIDWWCAEKIKNVHLWLKVNYGL